MAEEPSTSRKRRQRSPLPLEIIQKNVAVFLAQIMVNMTNVTLQAKCKELLDTEDLMEADGKILEILQKVDSEQQKQQSEPRPKRSK